MTIGDLKRAGADIRDDHGTPVNASKFNASSSTSNASTAVDDRDDDDDDFVELGGTPEGARGGEDERAPLSPSKSHGKKGMMKPETPDPWATDDTPRRTPRAFGKVEKVESATATKPAGADGSGLETPERAGRDRSPRGRDAASLRGKKTVITQIGSDTNSDDVNVGGSPAGSVDEEESQQNAPATQTPQALKTPADRFRRSNVEVRHGTRPGGMWASVASPMTAPFQGHPHMHPHAQSVMHTPKPTVAAVAKEDKDKALADSIDRATPAPAPAISKKRAAMRMSLPANMIPMTPVPISRQVLERIECLGPELNIVQRMMLVIGILLDFNTKAQLVRQLVRFAQQGAWVWFGLVLAFFVFSAFCITGYWVLHYPMPPKPTEGTVGKDNRVFGFSKYDFKLMVRRFGAACAMLQLGTAFAAWRALRTNDVRARKAEMDLRGMQLVDAIFLALPVATLQCYIGMSCSAPGAVCPGHEGFDILLFVGVLGSIISGTLCFVSLDLHEKPPAYSWPEYWKLHKSHLSEMIAKSIYRFFELAARICTLGLFAAVTGGYVFLVFFFHACVILGLIKLRLPGVHDKKIWERFCELRPFKVFGRKVNLPVLDDTKLLVACLIWPPSSYVSNAADRKGKFWWRSTSCPRKSFWGLMREDALVPFAVNIGVLTFEAAMMIIILAIVAQEHWYFFMGFAVVVNLVWLVSAINWMSMAALWNPFLPDGPPLGYPSVSALNTAIGGRRTMGTPKQAPVAPMPTPVAKMFAPSPPLAKKRLPLETVGEESQSTPVFGQKSNGQNQDTTPSLGPRTTPVMIKGSDEPIEVYVDMGDDSAEMNDEDDEVPPMVMASLGEEQMLRASAQWRESLQRTLSPEDDLEAARDALDFLNTTDDGSQYVGGTPCLASPAPYNDENENSSTLVESPPAELSTVSPILAPRSPSHKAPR